MRAYPPTRDFFSHNIDVFDPQYLSRLPMQEAVGFPLCRKLANDSPDQAVKNSYSVTVYALGKLVFHLCKHHLKGEKCSPPQNSPLSQ